MPDFQLFVGDRRGIIGIRLPRQSKSGLYALTLKNSGSFGELGHAFVPQHARSKNHYGHAVALRRGTIYGKIDAGALDYGGLFAGDDSFANENGTIIRILKDDPQVGMAKSTPAADLHPLTHGGGFFGLIGKEESESREGIHHRRHSGQVCGHASVQNGFEAKMMNEAWTKAAIEAEQGENGCRFFPHAGALAGHGDGMNRKIVLLTSRGGTAARGGYVNFQAEVASRMDQLHSISAEGIEAVVNKHDSWLGFHACCLHTIGNMDGSSLRDEFNWSPLSWIMKMAVLCVRACRL